MPRNQSIVNLDPIKENAKQNFISKLLVTRWEGGKPVYKTDPFGHYMFCGPQRSGKTASLLWYTQKLIKRYKKRKIAYEHPETGKIVKFDKAPRVRVYSNFGVKGTIKFNKSKIFDLIDKLDPYENEVRIFLIDEFHTYFPKDSTRKEDKETLADLTTVFSQLGKRNCYVLSTAQIYGRLDKRLREQCLFMVDNSINFNRKIVSDFILERKILCDELGRWSGPIHRRFIHGLANISYDTKRLIRE